jgi:hypothetical protein
MNIWVIKNKIFVEDLLNFLMMEEGNKCEVKVMLRLTVKSVSILGVESTLELVTRYYVLSESCCVVSVGRPL